MLQSSRRVRKDYERCRALAYALAHRGYNVMVVDADPQCDISMLFRAPSLRKQRLAHKDRAAELSQLYSRQGVSPDQAELRAVSEASVEFPTTYDHEIDRSRCMTPGAVRTLYEAMENFRIPGRQTEPLIVEPFEILPQVPWSHGKVVLMAGHDDTLYMEDTVCDAERSRSDSINVAFLSLLYHIITRTAKASGCSFVLVDTNPFCGEFFRSLLTSSDYFVIMAGADVCSTNAVRKLCESVPGWYHHTRTIETNRKSVSLPGQGELEWMPRVRRRLGMTGVSPAGSALPRGVPLRVCGPYRCGTLLLCAGGVERHAAQIHHGHAAAAVSGGARLAPGRAARRDARRRSGFAVEDRAYTALNLVPGLLARFRHARSLAPCANLHGVPTGHLGKRKIVKASADPDVASTVSDGSLLFLRDRFLRAMDRYAWNILALVHEDSTAKSGAGRPWVATPEGWRHAGRGGPPDRGERYFEEEGAAGARGAGMRASRRPSAIYSDAI